MNLFSKEQMPSWLLSRQLTSFQRFFEMDLDESVSPFLNSQAKQISKNLFLKSAIASLVFLLLAVLFSFYQWNEWKNIALAFVYLLSGTKAAVAAVEDVFIRKVVNIDVLTTVAAFSALFMGAVFEGALLLVLFAIAMSLEESVTSKAKRALCFLNELRPNTAIVAFKNGELREKAVEDVSVNDIVLVRTGEMVPLDGVIVKGSTSLDLSHMTGESRPITSGVGDFVPSGAKVIGRAIEVQVTCTSTDSTLAKLLKLITHARVSKPKLSHFFEKYSQWYSIFVIGISLAVIVVFPLFGTISFFGDEGSIMRGMSFLVTASPCALLIALPITYLSALGASAQKGAIFKGWKTLDYLLSCLYVAFDKTGTITTGKLTLSSIQSFPEKQMQNTYIDLAKCLERDAVHPVAQAIMQLESEKKFEEALTHVTVIPGAGVEGQVEGRRVFIGSMKKAVQYLNEDLAKTVLERAQEKEKAGFVVAVLVFSKDQAFLFSFEDTIRKQSRDVVVSLQEMKKQVLMFTGDNYENARKVASCVNIPNPYALLLPDQKLALVDDFSKKDGLVMVGDGINDAPALAHATVGISMGELSSASARESSDIILLQNDLMLIPWLFQKAQKTRKIVIENLSVAIFAILVGTIFSLIGYIPLYVAVILHEGSTVVVGLNALRLLEFSSKKS